MAEVPPKVSIDVLFVGQTGVGKSSLINMIRRVKDTSPAAAKVSNEACSCPVQTTPYPMELGTGLKCQLWDTRGLNEAVESSGFVAKIMDQIRASQQERELKKAIRERTKTDSKPILIWCIKAEQIGAAFHWQQFRKVYVEYCGRKAIPVVVITRTPLARNIPELEAKCRSQLGSLESVGDVHVHLLMLREYRDPLVPSTQWSEDSAALRGLISRLVNSGSLNIQG